MVDPNRKINRFTEKDIEFLDECEEEFKDRYSENDEEFIIHCEKKQSTPPIIDPWMDQRHNNQESRGSFRNKQRGGNYYSNRRNNRNHHYKRNDYNYQWQTGRN